MFSYNLSRQYSYRWLPWATMIGGLVLAVLFSVFSLANTGYYLE